MIQKDIQPRQDKLKPGSVALGYLATTLLGYGIGLGLSHVLIGGLLQAPIPTVSVGPIPLDDVGLTGAGLVDFGLTASLVSSTIGRRRSIAHNV